jgi:hypothetical protein
MKYYYESKTSLRGGTLTQDNDEKAIENAKALLGDKLLVLYRESDTKDGLPFIMIFPTGNDKTQINRPVSLTKNALKHSFVVEINDECTIRRATDYDEGIEHIVCFEEARQIALDHIADMIQGYVEKIRTLRNMKEKDFGESFRI